MHEATAPAVRDTAVTRPRGGMGHRAGHGLGSNSPSWGQGSQHPSVRGRGVRMVPLAIPGVSDEANFHKEGGTVPKRCSCPKYLTREIKEKLSGSIYCRRDVAIARTVLGACSTRLPSPRSTSLTPDLGAGFTEVAGIKAPRLRVTPPGCIPAQLCPGQCHPVSSREPPDTVTLWLDGDLSLSVRSGSLLLFPLPAPRGVREGRPGRIRVRLHADGILRGQLHLP